MGGVGDLLARPAPPTRLAEQPPVAKAKTGKTLLGEAGSLNLNPVDGGSTWVQSSGTWGVYRFDYVFVSIRTSR